MSENSSTVKLGRPKSEEKRRTILNAASCEFLTNGFTNTSMDMVAKHANVSKQTVYSHFNNKDELYTAVIDAKCRQYRLDASRLENCDAPLGDVLLEIANQFINLLQDAEVISMYTVVIGEAKNNPHVAELFYRAGPLQSIKTLSTILMQFHPNLSAEQASGLATDFFNLLKADYHMRSLLKLPYELTQEQQLSLCQRVCKQIHTLLDSADKFVPVTHSHLST